MSTGRAPACLWPVAGFRSAQRTSPLSILAIPHSLRRFLHQPVPVLHADRASRIPLLTGFVTGAQVSRPGLFLLPGSDFESAAAPRGGRFGSATPYPMSARLWFLAW